MKPFESQTVAVTLGVGEMGQHLGDGEAVGSRLPAGIFIGDFGHQPAENFGRCREHFDACQGHALSYIEASADEALSTIDQKRVARQPVRRGMAH